MNNRIKYALGVTGFIVSGALLYYFVSAGLATLWERALALGFVIVVQGAAFYASPLIVADPLRHKIALLLTVFIMGLNVFAGSYFIGVSAGKSGEIAAQNGAKYKDISERINGLDETLNNARDRLSRCPEKHFINCINPAQAEIKELTERKNALLEQRGNLPPDPAAHNFWLGAARFFGVDMTLFVFAISLLRALLFDICAIWLTGTAALALRGVPVIVEIYPDEIERHNGKYPAALRKLNGGTALPPAKSNGGNGETEPFTTKNGNGGLREGKCAHCGAAMALTTHNKRFCSDACRIAHWEIANGAEFTKPRKSQLHVRL